MAITDHDRREQPTLWPSEAPARHAWPERPAFLARWNPPTRSGNDNWRPLQDNDLVRNMARRTNWTVCAAYLLHRCCAPPKRAPWS